jgi:hypothetical protein
MVAALDTVASIFLRFRTMRVSATSASISLGDNRAMRSGSKSKNASASHALVASHTTNSSFGPRRREAAHAVYPKKG